MLAYENAATFDANIACWDAKLFYWYIRPVQADPAITVPIPQANHPSYPSGHSCVTSAIMTVLADAFPTEREYLDAIISDADLSRVYGGIHYRFDIAAGHAIGRAAAVLALGGNDWSRHHSSMPVALRHHTLRLAAATTKRTGWTGWTG